jgi:hypothetical protein
VTVERDAGAISGDHAGAFDHAQQAGENRNATSNRYRDLQQAAFTLCGDQ